MACFLPAGFFLGKLTCVVDGTQGPFTGKYYSAAIVDNHDGKGLDMNSPESVESEAYRTTADVRPLPHRFPMSKYLPFRQPSPIRESRTRAVASTTQSAGISALLAQYGQKQRILSRKHGEKTLLFLKPAVPALLRKKTLYPAFIFLAVQRTGYVKKGSARQQSLPCMIKNIGLKTHNFGKS